MSPGNRLLLAAVCAASLSCLAVAPGAAGDWSFSAGAGGTTGYGLSGPDRNFGPAWIVTADAARRLGDRWELRATAGGLHFSRPWPLSSIPEVRITGTRSVDFAPVGVGLRILSPVTAIRPTQVYAEAIPSLVVSRWRSTESWFDMTGPPPYSGSSDIRTTRVLAGFMAGAGILWRAGPHLRPGLAARYLFSAAPGDVAPFDSSPGGLSAFAACASLGWEP